MVAFILQSKLEQERRQHEETLAAVKEEEKLQVGRMAHDLEMKWTENLRYGLYSLMSSYCAKKKLVFYLNGLHCLMVKDVVAAFFFFFKDLFIWVCWVLVAACELLDVACGIQFPDKGSNPGPLYQEYRVLATEPPGKSIVAAFLINFSHG